MCMRERACLRKVQGTRERKVHGTKRVVHGYMRAKKVHGTRGVVHPYTGYSKNTEIGER